MMINRTTLLCAIVTLFADRSSYCSAFSPVSRSNAFVSTRTSLQETRRENCDSSSSTRLYFHVINGGGLADPRDWPDDDAEDLEEGHYHERNMVEEETGQEECSSLEEEEADEEGDDDTTTITYAMATDEEMELMIGSRERDLINNSFQACMDMTSTLLSDTAESSSSTTITIDLVEEDAWQ